MYAINSFGPVVSKDSKILILGSIPGKESLRMGQYYAYRGNQFWKIVFQVFDAPYCDIYEERLRFLLGNGIALWDVVGSCERDGSLDSNIRNERSNDLKAFFRRYPRIRRVFFNGTKAHSIFRRRIGFDLGGMEFELLPSTSPANTIGLDKKVEAWKKIAQNG